MAGFRAEEYAIARVLLDTLGAHRVKVLPATQPMLEGSVEAAVHADEVDWGAPRPEGWIMGGAWGSQRTILFSGLPLSAQVRAGDLEGDGHVLCWCPVAYVGTEAGGVCGLKEVSLVRAFAPPSPPAHLIHPNPTQPKPPRPLSSSCLRPRACRPCASPWRRPAARGACWGRSWQRPSRWVQYCLCLCNNTAARMHTATQPHMHMNTPMQLRLTCKPSTLNQSLTTGPTGPPKAQAAALGAGGRPHGRWRGPH
jgi:hypothetical protein